VADFFGIEVETARPDSVVIFQVSDAVFVFALLIAGPLGVLPVLVGSIIVRYLERKWEQPLGYFFNLAQIAMTYCVFLALHRAIGVGLGLNGPLNGLQVAVFCLLYPLWDDMSFSLLISMGSGEPVVQVYRNRFWSVSWIAIITVSMGVLAAIVFRVDPWLVLPAIIPLFLAHRAMARLATINRELEAQVQARTADLQRALEVKDAFLAIAAHELRTPLTSIVGSLGLLTDSAFTTEAIPPRVLKALRVAHSNSERLARLINNILDLQKLEADAMVFDLQPLDLGALAAQAITTNSAYADVFEVTLVLEPAPQRYEVVADSDRLLQVLTNLLSNACKFSSPGGQVVVDVAAHHDMVRIAVRDHGPGIPEAFRDRVFERFAQASVAANRRQGGTGLGLSIAKSIVEKLGGRIGFDTELQIGTTFFVDLPLYRVVDPAEQGAGSQMEVSATQRRGAA
jgi:signal transduction histidine kinase